MKKTPLFAVLLLAVAFLGAELVLILPAMLGRWHPYDYWQYTEMGKALLNRAYETAPGRYYPLPTVIWLFVPLALAPDWFRLLWILFPFASILYLCKKPGLLLFFFTPLWIALENGSMEPLLLIPIAWVLQDTSWLAPLGVLLLLLKPQLALLLVAYRVCSWVVGRNWKQLGVMTVGMVALCLPAFVLQPNWPALFLQTLPLRAAENLVLQPKMSASIWSWWALDNPLRFVFFPLFLSAGLLFIRAVRYPGNRAAALLALWLLVFPIFFASSLVSVLPALRHKRQALVVVCASLLAYVVDQSVGPFGGLNVLATLAGLYFLGEEHTAESTRPQFSLQPLEISHI